MIKFKKNKQIFKRNYPLYFIFALLTFINLLYVSVEVNKPNILKAMGYDVTKYSVFSVSQSEVERLSAVSNYSLLFESAFIIISMLWIVFLLTKKVRPFFKSMMIITVNFFLFLFLLNIAFAIIFSTPYGNLVQLLIIPFQILLLVCIYGFLKFKNESN